ncbi:peptidase family M1-domain-containing protein [Talaromyces proteolyticus]|uniref:Aminopeptidase n=1 Tax=Talaromyces proteolyticus TaxID=1131652 RepID=A0AAD4KFF3_9EURO|nr:peptidase family M1-domain-containing protein [Talaromyces proteolyticus]KAH8691108.1 peptidase family M1-domain-containing protein [Talaromyces proteolyticus]
MASGDRDILPDVLKPKHYDLSLFDLELGGSWSYRGTVKIETSIVRPTQEIVLNANDITVQEARVLADNGSSLIKASDISWDKKSERVTLSFDKELASGDVVLKIDFAATMNDQMVGFYRSKYKSAGVPSPDTPKVDEFHYMLSTQFQACDARRAFPCLDEPNLKATFDFEIEIPNGLVALGNMPVKSERAGNIPGRKVVSFERSPIMSTYLLAWAIGDFEYVEALTQRKYNGSSIPIRLYTTRGLKDQAHYALECAHRTVDYFSELFGIDYPLPKSDLLAVHEFTAGAMENWGLITYRTTSVLFDEGSSDERYKNYIAYVVAHELAHQWFGNLVTMDWWNDLWLNEGFATWVGWFAVDHFYPGWNVWSQFVAESVQEAFKLDSLRASHPIEVPVKNAIEVDQLFDRISYEKGSSIIRMLSSYLGQETFLRGVSDYLKKHAYGNATTDDLWSALSKASNQDINAFMDPWVRKIGFPVVTIAGDTGQITVRQSRFLSSGDVKAEEDQTIWWIPLNIKTEQKPSNSMPQALTERSNVVRGIDDSFYKVNKDQCGFYRTNYPPDRLAKLGESLHLLSMEDKIGLIGDASALAISGEGTTAALLALLEGFTQETSYRVWSQISSSLANLRSVFASNEIIAAGLKKFTLKLVTPSIKKIRWDVDPKEDFLTGQLRRLLISLAGSAGHEETITEGKRIFHLWACGKDPNAIHPTLRLVIFSLNIEEGGRVEFDKIKNTFLQTEAADAKEICLSSLGRTKDSELVGEYLDLIFSDHVAIQDIHSGAASLASNSQHRYLLWEYMKTNWDSVVVKISSNNVVFERFLRLGLAKLADGAAARDIEAFFQDKDTGGYDRSLVVVLDSIRADARYKTRDEQSVVEWLQAHGYA